MDKEIFIVRHGRTEYNKLGIWQGSSVDAPLDEVGKEQAEYFYESYKRLDFDLVVYSDLQRTKQTISKFIDLGIEHKRSSMINEISWGHNEGKPHTEASLKQYRDVIGEWKLENYQVGFPGGESAADIGGRIAEFVNWLRICEYKKVLVCSHGRAIRCLLCIMKGEPLKEMEKYRHANTGVFVAMQKSSNFEFRMLNDTSHLEGH